MYRLILNLWLCLVVLGCITVDDNKQYGSPTAADYLGFVACPVFSPYALCRTCSNSC